MARNHRSPSENGNPDPSPGGGGTRSKSKASLNTAGQYAGAPGMQASSSVADVWLETKIRIIVPRRGLPPPPRTHPRPRRCVADVWLEPQIYIIVSLRGLPPPPRSHPRPRGGCRPHPGAIRHQYKLTTRPMLLWHDFDMPWHRLTNPMNL